MPPVLEGQLLVQEEQFCCIFRHIRANNFHIYFVSFVLGVIFLFGCFFISIARRLSMVLAISCDSLGQSILDSCQQCQEHSKSCHKKVMLVFVLMMFLTVTRLTE